MQRVKVWLLLAVFLCGVAAAGVGATVFQGFWLPDVMIIERSGYQIFPPRWNLSVYPGGYKHEFLTDEELGKFIEFYCHGIETAELQSD